MKIKITIVSCLFVCAAMGQNVYDFYLISEAGDKLGPFSLKDGQKISVPEGSYSVQLADTFAVAEKLRTMIIPRVNFENATLEQTVRYLKHKSRLRDLEGGGIDIIFRDKPLDEDEQVEETADSEDMITLEVTNVSISQCLSLICKQTNSSWSIVNGRVVIER